MAIVHDIISYIFPIIRNHTLVWEKYNLEVYQRKQYDEPLNNTHGLQWRTFKSSRSKLRREIILKERTISRRSRSQTFSLQFTRWNRCRTTSYFGWIHNFHVPDSRTDSLRPYWTSAILLSILLRNLWINHAYSTNGQSECCTAVLI